jgi:uncharacterized protein YgfB (UPF0149 family)
MTMMNLPDFDLVSDAVRSLNQDLAAAELHGQLCGLLCTVSGVDLTTWLHPCFPQAGEMDRWPVNTLELLQDILNITENQIKSADFEFSLLLPDDSASIDSRIEILGEWCQGFLLGISQGGVTDIKALPGDLPEFIDDMVNLGRVNSYDQENENEDETSYFELMEYVRVGVQLFWEELASLAEDAHADDEHLH